MTTVTPDIEGPGIDEEYADLRRAIDDLRKGLGPRPLDNATPDGRVLLEAAWLDQEIARQRLPIPVGRTYTNTIHYLSGSGELSGVAGVPDIGLVNDALRRLILVLDGVGLMKPRHVPVLLAMIDELYGESRAVWAQLDDVEHATMDDLRSLGDTIRAGGWPPPRRPQDQFPAFDIPNLERLIPNFGNKARRISMAIYDGRRPYPAQKPPMPAPVAGLPEKAPPLPPSFRN